MPATAATIAATAAARAIRRGTSSSSSQSSTRNRHTPTARTTAIDRASIWSPWLAAAELPNALTSSCLRLAMEASRVPPTAPMKSPANIRALPGPIDSSTTTPTTAATTPPREEAK